MAWETIRQLLPSRHFDVDFWWSISGSQLAMMMEAAQYPVAKQYEILMFHYYWITPYLGKAFRLRGDLQWHSVLGVEGLPIEYSWKWNTAETKPEIRYTMEAISQLSGTAADPLNQDASRVLLHKLNETIPTVDASRIYHFLSSLYDHDRSKYLQEAAEGTSLATTVLIAAEFPSTGVSLKTYFIPRKLGNKGAPITIEAWEETLCGLEPESTSRIQLWDFLKTNAEGKLLQPFMVAIDNVVPEKSRLKLYCRTPRTNFASIREIMTVGGRISVSDNQFEDLRSLVAAAVGLDANFSEELEWPLSQESSNAAADAFSELPALQSGLIYYFDIASGIPQPGVKLYIMVRHYGPDDLILGQAIADWMESHGRGGFCGAYLSMLQKLSPDRQLSGEKGIQVYLSCMFKNSGELEVTSYVAPRGFPPTRSSSPGALEIQPRVSLRRRDS